MVAARSVVTNTKEATEMVNYREILRLSSDPVNFEYRAPLARKTSPTLTEI